MIKNVFIYILSDASFQKKVSDLKFNSVELPKIQQNLIDAYLKKRKGSQN